MDTTTLNPVEMSRGISEFGFMTVASACFLLTSLIIQFLFIRWLMRIINDIIGTQQLSLKELLQSSKEQDERQKEQVERQKEQGRTLEEILVLERDQNRMMERITVDVLHHYWNRWQADRIQSQALANILVDWVWCSGRYGILIPQSVLKVKTDGIVGEETLSALNNYPNPEELFNRLKAERIAYIERICKARPANNRFKKGWLNRIASFRFFAIAILFIICLCWGGCKSIPQQKRMKTSTETIENAAKNVDSTANKQLHQLAVSRMEQDSEEGSVTETIVINFDTSLPKDTATGNHPVKSITKTTTVKNLKVSASTDKVAQTDVKQTDRLTDKSKTTVIRNEESLDERRPGKDSYLWRYLAVAVIVLAVGWILFRWKAGR